MRVDRTIYCDGPAHSEGDDGHGHCNTHETTTRHLPSGWIQTTWIGVGDTPPDEKAFCDWQCVMRHAATHPEPEVILWTQALGGNPDEDGD